MNQLILGVLIIFVGLIFAYYGNYLNQDWEIVLDSFWNDGVSKPGNIWIYIGIGIIVVGVVLAVVGFISYSNANKKRDERLFQGKQLTPDQKQLVQVYKVQLSNGVITKEQFNSLVQEILDSESDW